jgi:hypothetical protein
MAPTKCELKNTSGIWHICLDRASGHALDTLVVVGSNVVHGHFTFTVVLCIKTITARSAKTTKCVGKGAAAVRLLFIMADRIHEDLRVLFKMCFFLCQSME